jgi:hypothetical protein
MLQGYRILVQPCVFNRKSLYLKRWNPWKHPWKHRWKIAIDTTRNASLPGWRSRRIDNK